jgi:hypothetical protein
VVTAEFTNFYDIIVAWGFGSAMPEGVPAVCYYGTLLFKPSLIATISFMTGGFIVANFILPLILKL